MARLLVGIFMPLSYLLEWGASRGRLILHRVRDGSLEGGYIFLGATAMNTVRGRVISD